MIKIVARNVRSGITSDNSPDSVSGTDNVGSIIHTALSQRFGSSLIKKNVMTKVSQTKTIRFVNLFRKCPVLVSAPPPYGKVFLIKNQLIRCPRMNKAAVANSGDMKDFTISVMSKYAKILMSKVDQYP